MSVVTVDLEVRDKDGTAKVETMAASFRNLGGEAVKAGAFVEAGMEGAAKAIEFITENTIDLIREFVEFGHQLDLLHTKINVPLEIAAAWQQMQSVTGQSAEGIANSIAMMDVKLEQGNKQALEALSMLGVGFSDLKEAAPEEQVRMLAEAMQRFVESGGKADVVAKELFGKGGLGMLPVLTGAAQDLQAQLVEINGPLEHQAEVAHKYEENAALLSAHWQAIRRTIAAPVVGGLASFFEFLNKGAYNKEWLDPEGPMKPAAPLIHEDTTIVDVDKFNKAADAEAKRAQKLAEQLHEYTLKIQDEFDKMLDHEKAANDKFNQDMETRGRHAYWALETDADKYAKKIIDSQWKAWLSAKDAEAAAGDAMVADAKRVDAELADSARRRNQDMVDSLHSMADAFAQLGGAVGQFGSDSLNVFANLKDEGLQAASVWQKVAIAIQGAVNAYSAGQHAGSGGKGALAGAGKGAMAGAAFGVPGMIVGGVIGAAAGWFGGKHAEAEELKSLSDQFRILQEQAKYAGVTLDHAFDTKSVASMKAAVRDLQLALDMQPAQDEFNKLMLAAQRAGIQFKEAFDTHDAIALKNSIDAIKKALDLNAEAQQKLNDAIQRYGFTTEELGPALSKQKLDEQMAQIYQDWQLLTAAGVDHEAMLNRIGPSVGNLVDQYNKGGQEIPSAMKPIIDDLYTHGKLLHDNGEAYTEAEYNGLSYAQTMSQMFQELIDKVNELVDALLGIPNVNRTVTLNTQTTGGEPAGGVSGRPSGIGPEGMGGRAAGGGHSFSFHMGGVNVNGSNAREIADGLAEQLERRTVPRLAAAFKRNVLA